MNFCPNCGTKLSPEGVKFCPDCGTILQSTIYPAPPTVVISTAEQKSAMAFDAVGFIARFFLAPVLGVALFLILWAGGLHNEFTLGALAVGAGLSTELAYNTVEQFIEERAKGKRTTSEDRQEGKQGSATQPGSAQQ